MTFPTVRVSAIAVLWILSLALAGGAAPNTAPRVDVILWFDTEDFLLTASDDAALRLAQLLQERGIRATFKIVGEKARTLERRGRNDVIDALRAHCIGYHSDLHSVHPTPTEYLAECGWLDGVAEFTRREAQGAADVRRIFGVKTLGCYGQPGSSWAPQATAALPAIGVAPHGVPCYVDEGAPVGLDHKPFWYAGALHVFNMGHGTGYTRMELHDEAAVAPANEEVSGMAARLRSEGGGLISIFYHPCEWVHQEFWDGVNFARGANPPREAWKPPAQRPPGETEAAFRRFAAYIDHIRALPGVHFVTAEDLPILYPDPLRQQTASGAEVAALAAQVAQLGCASEQNGGPRVNYMTLGNKAYSPADQFELLVKALIGRFSRVPAAGLSLSVTPLLGPDAAPPATPIARKQISTAEFQRALADVESFIRQERRVPSRVFVGADAIAPAAFLAMMGAVLSGADPLANADFLISIPATPSLATEKHIAADTPKLFGDWVIHREGFRAPKLMEQARLQAWTLKPALRAAP